MKKLSMLDKCINKVDSNYGTFKEWSHYETHWSNGEYEPKKAPIHRMLICEPVWNLSSQIDTHFGSCGDTHNVSAICLVLNDVQGEVLLVEPAFREHKSNYAYEKGFTKEGVTVAQFMESRGIKPEQVKFVVKIVQEYESWKETHRERSVTIYGRTFKPSTVLDSFKEIHGLNPWILHTTAQPETVYGHINMDSEDLERIRIKQQNNRVAFEEKRDKVRKVMKFVFGPEMATKLVNFIHFGEF